MREAIERVIAELDERITKFERSAEDDTLPFGSNQFYRGRANEAKLIKTKLKVVLAEYETGDTRKAGTCGSNDTAE